MTLRNEADIVSIQSGVEGGVILGTPITVVVKNQDSRPSDYKGNTMKQYPRPSHADFIYLEKYGVRASSGGGRSSAREIIGCVAAGALCEHYLKFVYGIEIVAWVSSVGSIHHIPPTTEYPCTSHNPKFLQLLQGLTWESVDKSPVWCPDPEVAARMEHCIADFRDR
jgi:chorismate synthase